MKRKKKLIIVAVVTFVMMGFCLFYRPFSQTTPAYVYSPESQYPVFPSSASFHKLYNNGKELYKEADLVAKVEVKNHRFEQQGSLVSTYTDVQLLKVYKGDSKLQMVKVCEFGGLLNTQELNLPQKEGEPPAENGSGKQGMVESTLEGSPTMRSGNQYIVFLKKDPDQGFYTIVGSVQGKIKIDDKKNLVLGTVKEDRVKKDDLYFLQKKYVGKKVNDLDTEIQSMK